jgi:hypothetical protein
VHQGLDDDLHVAVALADADLLPGLDLDGRDVDDLAVKFDMAVRDELAGRRARRREAQAEDDVVQAAFAHLEQDVSGVPLLGAGSLVELVELLLTHPVDEFGLLLLAKLRAIVGDFPAALCTVDSGRIRATFKHLVGAEDWLTEAARYFGFGTDVATHGTIPSCDYGHGSRYEVLPCSREYY